MSDDKITFIGQVTASISHEMNNVLSIIDQVNGLLEDELYAFESGKNIDPEKLYRIHDKIDYQAMRGISIVKNLNKFAHSSDYDFCDFELNGLLKSFVDVCRRFADLKHFRLNTDFPGYEIKLHSSPILIQQALFNILKYCFETGKQDSDIQIMIKNENKEVLLQLGFQLDNEEVENQNVFVADEIIRELKGEVKQHVDENQYKTIRFLLPESI